MTTDEFIRVKIVQTEKAILAREQSLKVFRSGTDETWAMAAELHYSSPMTKSKRRAAANCEARIIHNLCLERDMFRAVLNELLDP